MPRAKADETLKKAAQKLASASRAGGAAVKKAAAKVAKAPSKAAAPAKSAAKTPAKSGSKAAAKAAPKAPAKAAPAAAAKATKSTTKTPAKAATKAASTKAPVKATKAVAAEKAPVKATTKAATPASAAPPVKVPERSAPGPVKKALPKANKKHVLDKFEIEQKELLIAERAEYVSSAEALKAEADQLAAEMEPGDVQFDEESGEGGTSVIDRERDLAMSAQARLAVEEIDHALVKLHAGTYGPCENCGQPIPKARLKALPHARLCVACKSGGLSRR